VTFPGRETVLEAIGAGWFRGLRRSIPASNWGLFEPGQELSRGFAREFPSLLNAHDICPSRVRTLRTLCTLRPVQ